MPAKLTHNAYGKHQVRVSKIKRPRRGLPRDERHEFIEASIDIELQGDFAAAYTQGDNSLVVATDTCKNTVYALAKDDPFTTIESFGIRLAEHFIKQYAHVLSARVQLSERVWRRLLESPHCFTGGERKTPTATVVATRGQATKLASGIRGLVIAKTTESGFANFHRDEFRTLADTSDRVFATELSAEWNYAKIDVPHAACRETIERSLLDKFADHYSRSVQETLMLMGQHALEACPEASSITITMPNKHHLLANLAPFGRENENEVFVATDEPFGWITGTICR